MDAISVRLTKPEYKALLEIKKSEGLPISWLVSAAVKEYVAKRKNGAKETRHAKIKKNQEGNKAAQKNATKIWNAKHASGKVSIVK